MNDMVHFCLKVCRVCNVRQTIRDVPFNVRKGKEFKLKKGVTAIW